MFADRRAASVCTCGSLAGLFVACALASGPAVRAQAPASVHFTTEDGVSIAGSLFVPDATPAPAVLLLHMLARSRRDWDGLAARLVEAGFVVLTIDLRGHGESGPNPAASNDDLLPMRLDVKAARLFVKAQPGVRPDRLGMAGASVGANLAIIDAATDPAVQAIALLSAGVDYRNLRPEAALRNYDARPALLVSSAEDAYALRSMRRFETVGTGVRRIELYEGAGHGSVMLQRQPELAELLVDWFRSRLL